MGVFLAILGVLLSQSGFLMSIGIEHIPKEGLALDLCQFWGVENVLQLMFLKRIIQFRFDTPQFIKSTTKANFEVISMQIDLK